MDMGAFEGFTGVQCEVDIDDCAMHECANGARCMDGVGGYTCQCTQLWTGLYSSTVHLSLCFFLIAPFREEMFLVKHLV